MAACNCPRRPRKGGLLQQRKTFGVTQEAAALRGWRQWEIAPCSPIPLTLPIASTGSPPSCDLWGNPKGGLWLADHHPLQPPETTWIAVKKVDGWWRHIPIVKSYGWLAGRHIRRRPPNCSRRVVHYYRSMRDKWRAFHFPFLCFYFAIQEQRNKRESMNWISRVWIWLVRQSPLVAPPGRLTQLGR